MHDSDLYTVHRECLRIEKPAHFNRIENSIACIQSNEHLSLDFYPVKCYFDRLTEVFSALDHMDLAVIGAIQKRSNGKIRKSKQKGNNSQNANLFSCRQVK